MKRKNYNGAQILIRVYKQTLRAVPVSAALGILNYLMQGLLPAILAGLLAGMYDAAEGSLREKGFEGKLLQMGGMILAVYGAVYLLQLAANVAINAGIYETCTSFHKLKLTEKNARIPFLALEDSGLLNLRRRAQDCAEREILSQIFMSSVVFVTNGIGIASVISVLASYSLWLVPIAVLSVLPFFYARLTRGKEFYRIRSGQARENRKLDDLWRILTTKESVKEMRVTQSAGYVFDKWRRTRDEVAEALRRENRKEAKSCFSCESIKILGYCVSIFIALALVLNQEISIGVFGACIAAFASLQNTAKNFLMDLGKLPEQLSFAGDYFAYLELEWNEQAEKRIENIRFTKKMEVKNVCFRYPGCERDTLKDVNFSIREGEKIAIVGENGSGKTTLSKILLGLYPPNAGEVFLDGCLLEKHSGQSFREQVSLVSQDFVRYALTLRENVGISDIKELSNDAKIRKALERTKAELRDPETQMGKAFGGLELSGGQWQKIAVARGIFRERGFLILDEPTSALDSLAEADLLRTLLKMAEDKTAVIISHRVSLCRFVSRILVLKDGRICEMGSHRELLEKRGEYARLYMEQKKWYDL